MKMVLFPVVIAASALALVGCSGSSSGGGGGTSNASVAIQTSGSVTLDATKHANINFTVANFTLQAPGTGCAASSGTCGHIHLLIDGTACNAPQAPYNNEINAAGPALAQFNYCSAPTGAHTITMELHHDDHSPVKDANGNTISATSNVTTQ